MELRRYDDPATFRADAGPFLAAREAEHNLLLGIAGRLEGGPYRAPSEPYLVTLHDRSGVRLAGILTPPHRLVLSEGEDDLPMGPIVADLVAGGWQPAGVLAPTARALEFARLWNEAAGGSHAPATREWIYRLTAVRPPVPIPGTLRPIEARDRDLVIGWLRAFYREAVHAEVDEVTASEAVDARLAGDPATAFVWDDGVPRSMAMATGPTPNGIRINGVYTPPEYRGRGFARACVAAVSARMLAEGRRFCFLFADADYPTSNFVYQSIGYERVTEVQEIDFSD